MYQNQADIQLLTLSLSILEFYFTFVQIEKNVYSVLDLKYFSILIPLRVFSLILRRVSQYSKIVLRDLNDIFLYQNRTQRSSSILTSLSNITIYIRNKSRFQRSCIFESILIILPFLQYSRSQMPSSLQAIVYFTYIFLSLYTTVDLRDIPIYQNR